MLSDSYWFMYDPDEQAITSGTTRTAGVRTGRWTDIVSAFNMSKGVTWQMCSPISQRTLSDHNLVFIARSVYRL